jgi:hypothetical protein
LLPIPLRLNPVISVKNEKLSLSNEQTFLGAVD